MSTPRKTRSQGPAEDIDIDHPHGHGTKPSRLNIENELTFYGSYHHTLGNKIIHFICIPLISWSSLVLLSHFSWPRALTYVFARGLAYQPSVALVVATAYQLYYMLLDPIAGLTFLPWSAIMYLTATYTYHFPPTWAPYQSLFHPTAVPLAWIVFTAAWIGQFIGHGVFERRAPALKDNLVQGGFEPSCRLVQRWLGSHRPTLAQYRQGTRLMVALVTAPFFVHLELMFEVFGFKPDMAKRVKKQVDAKVRAFHHQTAKHD